ncbi:MAG: sugar transferase [Bacteroidetes bacterium]|nr:sugar transferase [Bacteroidota bacterium]
MHPRRPIYGLTVLCDLCVALVAWWVSGNLFGEPLDDPSELIFLLLLLAGWGVFLRWWDSYRSPFSEGPLKREWVRLIGAVVSLLSFSGLLALLAPLWDFYLPRWIFFGSLLLLGSIGERALLRLLLQYYYGRTRRRWRVLIVGTGPPAQWMAQSIRKHGEWGLELLGLVRMPFEEPLQEEELPVGSATVKMATQAAAVRSAPVAPVVGAFSDLPRLLDTLVIDEVLVGFSLEHYEAIERLTRLCHQYGIPLRIPSRLLQTEEDFTLIAEPIRGWQAALKRGIDLLGAFVGLILLLPLMLLIALLIRLTSPGAPALYVQDRVGYHKRIFRMYKFRTMVPNAEQLQQELEELNEADGPVFKIRNDPRITSIGRFLRKHSLDELPQLINVLLGDMSLVGPRPLPLRDYQRFTDPRYKRRFAVKPGLTCLWQISGRSDLRFEEWIRLDLAYVDNWSLALDLRILLKTIPVVLLGKGAY